MVKEYTKEREVLKALKQQIVRSVNPKYLQPIFDKAMGLRNYSIPDIFVHLFRLPTTCVSPSDVQEKYESTIKEGDGFSEEMSSLFTKIEDFKAFAERGDDDHTNKQLCNMTVTMIHKTGKYDIAYHAWQDKPTADKHGTILRSIS